MPPPRLVCFYYTSYDSICQYTFVKKFYNFVNCKKFPSESQYRNQFSEGLSLYFDMTAIL